MLELAGHLVQSLLLPRSWATLELPLELELLAPAPASFQVRGGSMFGLRWRAVLLLLLKPLQL